MGGSGGRSAQPSASEMEEARRQVREDLRRQEIEAELNDVLAQELAGYNDRDTDLVQERLDAIAEALVGDALDVDRSCSAAASPSTPTSTA